MPDQEITIRVKAAPIESGSDVSQGLGVFTRAAQRVGGLLDGWFGPGQSLPPQAPPGTETRSWDYPYGVNLQTTARPFAPIPFQQLRQFSRAYPLLRVAIEKLKDRICSKTWTIQAKRDPNETPAAHAARTKNDPVAQKLTQLFERPDLENSWRRWIRKVLNDHLVLDAAAISVQRTKGGGIYRLMVVDGATITRKVDEQGMTPLGDDDVAYQQIIKGVPAIDLAKRDLLYAAENVESDRLYGYSRVEQVVQWAVLGMNRLLHQTNYYTEGSVPDAFAFLPEGTTPDQAEKWDKIFQSLMAGDSARKRKVWWMPWTGHVPVETKSKELTDKMDEMLNRFILYTFGLSPSALVPQVNRASAGQMADDADEAGETPVCAFVEDLINELIQSPQYGNLPGYRFSFETQAEVDTIVQKEIDQIDFACAAQTGPNNALKVLNEQRERDGKDPLEVDHERLPPGLGPDGGADPNDDPDPNAGNATPPAPPKKLLRRKALSLPANAKGKVLTIDPGESTPAKAKAEQAIAGLMRSFLEKQAGPLAKQVGAAYARKKAALAARTKADDPGDDSKDFEAAADDVMAAVTIDWSDLVAQVRPLLQAAAMSGVSRAGSELAAGHDIFDQANQWAIDYAEERGAELVGMKVVDGELVVNPNPHWAITETTRDRIRDLVVDALEDGQPPSVLKQWIRESTDFSDTRADMVATTETNFANSGGQFEVAKLVGHTFKRSLLSGDHDIDDECDDNAQATEDGADGIPLEESFPSGDMFSPFHPFCVCLTQTFIPGKKL